MDYQAFFYYLVLAIMFLGSLQAVGIGGLFFFKSSGVALGNYFYGLLLISIGLTLLHNTFVMLDLYSNSPWLNFLPIYFTLAFPPLLFYYVKLHLYPKYRLRPTDAKHFVLPVGQFLFFVCMFCLPTAEKAGLGRYFYNPFYGAFEQVLYLSTFFAYQYFSYRYLRRRYQTLKSKEEAKQVWYLRQLIKVLFVLFGIHACFVVGDFFSYEFLDINVRAVKPYTALGLLSFAAIVYWFGTYGFQVLLWGRRVFKAP